MKPIYVYDGRPPELKRETVEKREERPAVRVEKRRAEEVRRRLRTLRLLDSEYRPQIDGEHVLFPVLEVSGVEKLCAELGCRATRAFFEPRRRRPRTLREAVKGVVPENLSSKVPSSFDLVGEVAIVDIPRELEPYAESIGSALMRLYPRVKTVLAKEGGTSGDYRIRGMRVIAGSGETETLHREHGCIYRVDLRRAFFNPRMSGERLRVARAVRLGEYVADSFAGIGPFAILIARMNPQVRVLAIELNPDAHRLLKENIELNRVSSRVEAVYGDAQKVLEEMVESFDRIIMDLPFRSVEYLGAALKACKRGGIIHLYHVNETIEEAADRVIGEARRAGCEVEVVFSREVMEVAPRRHIFALDLRKLG